MKSKEPVMQRQNDLTQFDRFVETARALGCDEDKERFEEKLGQIAAHKPANDIPKTKKQKTKKVAKRR